MRSSGREDHALFLVEDDGFAIVVLDYARIDVTAAHVGRCVHMRYEANRGYLMVDIRGQRGEKIAVVVEAYLLKPHPFEDCFQIFCKLHLARSGRGHICQLVALCVESHTVEKSFGQCHGDF